MSYVTANQPNGTRPGSTLASPTSIGRWRSTVRSSAGSSMWDPVEAGRYTMCLLRGRPVAPIMPNPDSGATDFWWNVYLATDDCDATARRIADSGGTLIQGPMDVMDLGQWPSPRDPVGAQFGLWQGRALVGAQAVNEPNSLLRNDLVTPIPEPARAFYATVFEFTLDGNPDLPSFDCTFLRRPDGHEIGGIMGDSAATSVNGKRNLTHFRQAKTDPPLAFIRLVDGRWGPVRDPGL